MPPRHQLLSPCSRRSRHASGVLVAVSCSVALAPRCIVSRTTARRSAYGGWPACLLRVGMLDCATSKLLSPASGRIRAFDVCAGPSYHRPHRPRLALAAQRDGPDAHRMRSAPFGTRALRRTSRGHVSCACSCGSCGACSKGKVDPAACRVAIAGSGEFDAARRLLSCVLMSYAACRFS